MIESLRIRWPENTGPVASINPLISDYGIDLDRKLVSRGMIEASPAAGLTADDALANSAWWRSIRIIASIVSRTPFEIKNVEKSASGTKKSPATDHPAYYATTCQANSEETASDCRYRVASNAVIHGAGYAAIRRDLPDGLQLYPFESPGTRKMRVAGRLWYVFDMFPGDETLSSEDRFRKFPSEDVIEVSGLKKQGLLAYSIWYLAKNAIVEGTEGTKMRAARAKNNGRPSLALTTDAKINDVVAKRIQDDFQRIHSNFDGVGRPAVLDQGLKVAAIPYAADFQAEEALVKIPVREIANFTGVPSVFLGDPDGISYESLEKMIESLYRFCIEDYWHSWEDQIRAKMLSPADRRAGTMTAEFDRAAMLYMDGHNRALLIRAYGGGTPIATPNNIRNELGWEPLDDPEADKLQMPKNIGQDGSNNTPTDGSKPAGGRPKAEVDASRVMANAWDDTTRRILKAAERVSSNDKAFMAFCGTLDSDAEMRMLALERSRGAGAVYALAITEENATAGLAACKERLLEVAGAAKKGELHGVFHAAYGPLMVTLPELAAKAVLESANVR